MKIKLHYLLGDVHLGGHDVHRVARAVKKILTAAADAFDLLTVCDEPELGDMVWDEYFNRDIMGQAAGFIFNCGNYRFNLREEQERLEKAVSGGAGFLLMHGDHPCYWPAAGMTAWLGFEQMAGHVWREATSHGDFGNFHIDIDQPEHPVMRGLSGFDTRDEIFCTMENPYGVPFEVLASTYSNPGIISRHAQPGTGNHEPVAITGSFGKGRTFNMGLGHVWPFYTGHGLGENTMASWSPKPFRMMFARACEWIATGDVVRTRDFDGAVKFD